MNIFEFAYANEQSIRNAMLNQFKPYEMQSTFVSDFVIAEVMGGENAIRDTFNRASKEWLNNVEMFCELIMVLNHRCWMLYQFAEQGLEGMPEEYQTIFKKMPLLDFSQLYGELYYEAKDKFFEHWDALAESEDDKKVEMAKKAISYYYDVVD